MRFTQSGGTLDVTVRNVTIAGWTGRDTEAVAHHVQELQEIGVAPPSTTPLFYQVSCSLLTQSRDIQVLGAGTSGEAEPMLLRHAGTLWLGLGSDHTDRDQETISVAASKQACPKVCASDLWRFDEVADHLDQLRLRSWINEDRLYQDGALAAILPLTALMDKAPLGDGSVMMCGTIPAIGGIRSARHFRAELADPVLKRTIEMGYVTTPLDIIA